MQYTVCLPIFIMIFMLISAALNIVSAVAEHANENMRHGVSRQLYMNSKNEVAIPLAAVSIKLIYLGPVVQSIVSLTSSLRGQLVKCFATL